MHLLKKMKKNDHLINLDADVFYMIKQETALEMIKF